MDADVDHQSMRLQTILPDQAALTRACDDDVCTPECIHQVRSMHTATRGRREPALEHECHRQANALGLADDHGAFAEERDVIAVQELHDASRRARGKRESTVTLWIITLSGRRPPLPKNRHCICILLVVDGLYHPTRMHTVRERQLHDDTMHSTFALEPLYLFNQGVCGSFWTALLLDTEDLATDAKLGCQLDFLGHVDLAVGPGTTAHNSKAWHGVVHLLQGLNLLGHFLDD
mmetsp:Transcript_40267/g.102268  ORF Transcript_40267/g.102268 Transcript_40267/m.102268 type:complete len:233 (+) Transcript_40267:613-1311(+)|eukprot:CAMPEP_0183474016 /NCGR_PEP_ID=MMETSP0370-20130417/162391_1 /TAXON_ID=268820 /ORGANISM="Peridinium aciculiferum, Strain PAER-2" /LENGTH=232 /DNA_ID=CAMNT_0025666729 /DNA_START=522 /DNA_END=1220 /DNA_ORIENTATION=-